MWSIQGRFSAVTYSASDLMEAEIMCLETTQAHKILVLKPTERQALNIMKTPSYNLVVAGKGRVSFQTRRDSKPDKCYELA